MSKEQGTVTYLIVLNNKLNNMFEKSFSCPLGNLLDKAFKRLLALIRLVLILWMDTRVGLNAEIFTVLKVHFAMSLPFAAEKREISGEGIEKSSVRSEEHTSELQSP